MKKLFLAIVLSVAPFQNVSPAMTPQEHIEIVKSPEFQAILAKCIELMQKMGNSAIIIIQTLLREAGPKITEALTPILRAMGYPI